MGDVEVSDERGGEGHRSGHGIYAGLSGLGVSYGCDITSWIRAMTVRLQKCCLEFGDLYCRLNLGGVYVPRD